MAYKDPERAKTYAKKWEREHRERRRELGRKKYKENPVFYRNKRRKWTIKNLKRRAIFEKNWRMNRKNKNICIICGKKNRNGSECYCIKCLKMQRIRGYIRKFIALQRISGKRIPRCVKCGERDIRILSANHIQTLPREKLKKDRGAYLNTKVINGKRKLNDLEVRCFNCNRMYEFERKRLFFEYKFFINELRKRKIVRMSDHLK